MQIQISWLLQKPTDLDLHCLLRQGMSCLAREGLINSCNSVNNYNYLPINKWMLVWRTHGHLEFKHNIQIAQGSFFIPKSTYIFLMFPLKHMLWVQKTFDQNPQYRFSWKCKKNTPQTCGWIYSTIGTVHNIRHIYNWKVLTFFLFLH